MTTLIYGAGGMGREAAQLLRKLSRGDKSWDLTAFIDDHAALESTVHGLPVYRLSEAAGRHPGAGIVVAVGSPALRMRLEALAVAAGLRVVTVVDPHAEIGMNVTLGEGDYVAPGAILTCDVSLGRQVQVNAGCIVHHDAVIGDYVTLSPRATLLGAVQLGREVFVGAGAVLRQGVRVGDGALIGMGAVVLRNVPAGETWVGVPAMARDVTSQTSWLG